MSDKLMDASTSQSTPTDVVEQLAMHVVQAPPETEPETKLVEVLVRLPVAPLVLQLAVWPVVVAWTCELSHASPPAQAVAAIECL